ncbi:MFS transporter [Solimonas marina]|uniref:MFS transporter n=1 Tax=Solimonas marina TaxID=2714601 RepID=A0A969WBF3_9GAMM|nr:MFS transporter [Solimonas marina]NKF23020.1 MFS transporter [Solimonas marina]
MSDDSASGFAPLRQRTFAVLWAATVLGNTGTFMRDVASAWMVTELSPSATAVALIQTAATLPVFLLAIPAGVLSDLLDRRRFLIAVQLMLALVSLTLSALTASGHLTVPALVALTFAGGAGMALISPSWQAIVPELVPRRDLREAVALNSLGFNIARAIGPALGGALLLAFGAALTYAVDVLSYAAVIAALLWWRRAPSEQALPEHFGGAFRAGMRYVRASPALHIVLLRVALFFVFASAIWALLPLVARQLLGGGAGFYGLLLGAIGLGAIAGAVWMPRIRHRLGIERLLLGAAWLVAAVIATLTLRPPPLVAVVLLFAMGGAWIAALTTLNGIAQSVLPNWVRGRGLAVYLTVFNGAMAIGSFGWGIVAQHFGLTAALLAATLGLVAVALLALRWRLPSGDVDLQAAHHWAEPALAAPVEHERGPVLVQIEYRVDTADRAAFHSMARELSWARRRDGAYLWGLSEDTADPQRIVEWFFVESWVEHLRQHQRVSNADADLQRGALRFHRGSEPPLVRHLLALDARSLPPS